jgi:hypothetical protein
MSTKRPRLSYDGKIYVRPAGRGIVLEDEPGEPQLDDWIEIWLSEGGRGSLMSGFSTRIRIVVESAEENDP